MVNVSKPVAIAGGGLAALVAAAAAAYTGLPPRDGWVYKAVDWAFNTVKYATPEGSGLRTAFEQNPTYVAGMAGSAVAGVLGFVAGATAVFFVMRHYYSNRNSSKK